MNCHVCSNPCQRQGGKVAGVFLCSECGHIRRLYEGNQIQYHKEIYRTQKAHQRTPGEFDKQGNVTEKFHKARQEIVQKRLMPINPYIDKASICLDIGAGAGTFARELRPHVAKIDCIELAPNLISECKRLGFPTSNEDFLAMDFAHPMYDVVFAWHVLEHIEDARAFVKKMAEASKRYLVIEVPCNRRIRPEYDGHTHHFCRESLRMLLEQCGLKIIELIDGIQMPSILIMAQK